MASCTSARSFVAIVLSVAAWGVLCPTSEAQRDPPPKRYHFDIDPATLVSDLLPSRPLALGNEPAYLNEDLTRVRELVLGDPDWRNADFEKSMAHVIAKINHVNRHDSDGFVKALNAHRADLRGLPFLMGKDCRTEKERALVFAENVNIVRKLISNIASQEPEAASVPNAEFTALLVYREFPRAFEVNKSDQRSKRAQAKPSEAERGSVAALMQMFATQPPLFRVGLAQYLATFVHADASRALARLAIFSPEQTVQKAALTALQERPTQEFVDILLQGIRYPLPAVAIRAADALVELQCKEVLADLVDVLEQPDPRAPFKQNVEGKDVMTVREVVRVNHQRNCLLCHAPANTQDTPMDVLAVAVPLPNQIGEGYYRPSSPDIFVRTDVTYLRQDFSMLMPADDRLGRTSKKQRFDFLVQTRTLTQAEAETYASEIARRGTPPNHAAAQYALRELAGRSPAEATASEWRRLLNLR